RACRVHVRNDPGEPFMSEMIDKSGQPPAALSGKWGWFVALGVALIVLAVIAWLDVVAVTIAGTIFIGAMLLVGGVFQLVHAFMMQGWRSLLLGLLCAALSIIAGLLIMFEPLRGALVLTILVIAALIAGGVTRIVIGFRHREMASWGWLVLSGVISLIVAVLLYTSLPWSGLWVLGTLIAVELLVQGIGWLSFGLALRKVG
ncbi:MAG TPA: HdeD family acid-resistance protein, partial [Acetobacteraceae bacterium]|nr:HdeD family acid-resistance protein [Acetobacteraceae bacterium]